MHKIPVVALAVFLLGQTFVVKANQIDAIIDMSIRQMQREGDLGEITACLGVSEASFLQAHRDTMRYCFDRHGIDEASEAAMNNCFAKQSKQRLNVNDSVYRQCEEAYPDEESEQTEIDYTGMSEEDFEKQIQFEQQKGMEMLDSVLAMSKAASQGTEALVTLPIYSSSEIVSHYPKGMTNSMGKLLLPVATFVSSDSTVKVVEFYIRALPKFELDNAEGEVYTFMKKIPKDLKELSFDMDNLPLYSIPHIQIYAVKIDGKDKTNIIIVYQK